MSSDQEEKGGVPHPNPESNAKGRRKKSAAREGGRKLSAPSGRKKVLLLEIEELDEEKWREPPRRGKEQKGRISNPVA